MSIQYEKPRYGPLSFFLNVSTALKGTHNYIFIWGFQLGQAQTRLGLSLKMAWDLKFPIKEEEGLYNLYSKNKGTDQLFGYS